MIKPLAKYLPKITGLALKLPGFRRRMAKEDQITRRREAFKIVRQHCDDIFKAMDCHLEVRGKDNIPKGEKVVFLGNHQSYFDVVALAGAQDAPILFIAKAELTKWPIFSAWMKEMGCVFLDREDPRAAVAVINEGARRMKEEGLNGAIYPEGTRSKDGVIRDFQKGSFKLAQKADAWIVPVMVEGTNQMLEKTGKLTTGVHCVLEFLPAFKYSDLSKEDQRDIHHRVRQRIQDARDAYLKEKASY